MLMNYMKMIIKHHIGSKDKDISSIQDCNAILRWEKINPKVADFWVAKNPVNYILDSDILSFAVAEVSSLIITKMHVLTFPLYRMVCRI